MCSAPGYHWVVIIRFHICIILGFLIDGCFAVHCEVSPSLKIVKLSLLLSIMSPHYRCEDAYSVCS